MRQFASLIAALLLLVLVSGCASTKAYFVDRGHDALDVFTLTFGTGLGAKARVGPVMLACDFIDDFGGLQSGEIFLQRDPTNTISDVAGSFSKKLDERQGGYDNALFLIGSDASRNSEYVRARRKYYHAFYLLGIANDLSLYSVVYSPPYFSQIEIAVGLGLSVRLGFNPVELLDFLLGWFGIDIYDDDVEMKKARQERAEKSNPPLTPAKRDTSLRTAALADKAK
jgi:hypothetical protein